jgi:hypothetical protein
VKLLLTIVILSTVRVFEGKTPKDTLILLTGGGGARRGGNKRRLNQTALYGASRFLLLA